VILPRSISAARSCSDGRERTSLRSDGRFSFVLCKTRQQSRLERSEQQLNGGFALLTKPGSRILLLSHCCACQRLRATMQSLEVGEYRMLTMWLSKETWTGESPAWRARALGLPRSRRDDEPRLGAQQGKVCRTSRKQWAPCQTHRRGSPRRVASLESRSLPTADRLQGFR
jgi:hypothetical protein